MDLSYFLEKRLSLIMHFYEQSVAGFERTKLLIESGEEPFVDRRDPEYADGHAFQDEWDLADAAQMMVGAAALDYLQATLHYFLAAFLEATHKSDALTKYRKGGWYMRYRECFAAEFGIDWAASGADLEFIEQVILTRNDFAHGSELFTFYAFQDEKHAEKHPDSVFVDPRWKGLRVFRGKLTVSNESLQEAIEHVRRLCNYLEEVRIGARR